MAKVVSRSDDPGFYPKGGHGKMFERGTAHPAESSVSGKSKNGGEDKRWPEGGRGKMFGKGHAGHKEPAISGKATQVG